MISLEEAKQRILTLVQPLGTERVTGGDLLGRFAAERVCAAIDLPPFDNSAMDGYAVLASDTANATPEHPAILTLIGRIAAGEQFRGKVSAGSCVRIFTGSTLPAGVDAVVMQEEVNASESRVTVNSSVKPLENVRLKGEDVRRGQPILEIGERITPVRLGLLAAMGSAGLTVFRVPRVALLATGSELREPGEPLKPGEIYESNRAMLAGFLREIGCDVLSLPLVRDTLPDTIEALRTAFAQADVVISSGGVSVGEFDFVKEALKALGGEIDLWRIAMRPGKPFVCGRFENKFVFGLPGNPVSALVTFLLLVRPALLRMLGAVETELASVTGTLEERVINRGDRRHFVRVRYENGAVRAAGPQASHMIGSLGGANGLLEAAPGAVLEAGSRVTVLLWQLPGV